MRETLKNRAVGKLFTERLSGEKGVMLVHSVVLGDVMHVLVALKGDDKTVEREIRSIQAEAVQKFVCFKLHLFVVSLTGPERAGAEPPAKCRVIREVYLDLSDKETAVAPPSLTDAQ